MSLYGDMSQPTDTDAVWRALADPHRRRLLDLLAAGPRTTGALALELDGLCRTAVMKHLDVLVAAHLVVVRREGRHRWNHINPMPIRQIHDRWVAPHARGTAARLGRLAGRAESLARQGSGRTTPSTKTPTKRSSR